MLTRKCGPCGKATTHAYLRTGEHRDALEGTLPSMSECARLTSEIRARGVEVVDDVATVTDERPMLLLVWFPTVKRVEVRYNHAWSGRSATVEALRWALKQVEAGVDRDHTRRWQVGRFVDSDGPMLYVGQDVTR